MNWTLNNPMGWLHKLHQPKQPNEVSMKVKWKRLDNGIYVARADFGTKVVFATARSLHTLQANIKQNLRNNDVRMPATLDTNPSASIVIPENKLKFMVNSVLGRERAKQKRIYGVESAEDEVKKMLNSDEGKDPTPVVEDSESQPTLPPSFDCSGIKRVSKIVGDEVVVYEIKELTRYPLVSKGAF